MALQLHEISVAGPGMAASRVIRGWFTARTSGHPIVIRRHPGNPGQKVSSEQFSAACETAEKLGRYRIDDPEHASELALRRFVLGCARDDPADALVDFVVALEALLLPNRTAEMSDRFKVNGAHFIATEPVERPTLYKQLEELYDIRSQMVHGGRRRPKVGAIQKAVRDAYAMIARGLLKAVNDGFPNDPCFKRAALREPPRN
jgi:hypothetical protein